MLLVKQNDAWSLGSKIILHIPLCTEDIIIIKAKRDSRSLSGNTVECEGPNTQQYTTWQVATIRCTCHEEA